MSSNIGTSLTNIGITLDTTVGTMPHLYPTYDQIYTNIFSSKQSMTNLLDLI